MCQRNLVILAINLSIACVAQAGQNPAPKPKTDSSSQIAPSGMTRECIKDKVHCLSGIAAECGNPLPVRLSAVDSLGSIAAAAAPQDVLDVQLEVVKALKCLLCSALNKDEKPTAPETSCADTQPPAATPANANKKVAKAKPAADESRLSDGTAAPKGCECRPVKDFLEYGQRDLFVLHVVQALGSVGPPATRALDALAKANMVDDADVQTAIVSAQQAILTHPTPAQASTNSVTSPAAPTTTSVVLPPQSISITFGIPPQQSSSK